VYSTAWDRADPGKQGTMSTPDTTDEQVVETRGDEHHEILALDTTGNGTPDIWAIDTDGNGKADLFQIDTDGDGRPDITMTDLTEDGEMDAIVDGDGGHPVE
jgi:hypothetical protein